ncbi:MAG: hypothetical protein LBE08_07090 [Bifidobacteriaceae bacterium]|nr:hypothetical protein [Bifidobacteriaceae bacterium]
MFEVEGGDGLNEYSSVSFDFASADGAAAVAGVLARRVPNVFRVAASLGQDSLDAEATGQRSLGRDERQIMQPLARVDFNGAATALAALCELDWNDDHAAFSLALRQ